MKSVINFFKNLFTSKKEEEVKIETIDHISHPETINPCGCDDCRCGKKKKTYIIPVGARTSEEAEKSLRETIASFKEEVIILPEDGIKLEVKEEVKEDKAKNPRKPYKKKDSNNSSKGKGKKKNSETSKK
jgi:DNA recombination-dependent growth factor C